MSRPPNILLVVLDTTRADIANQGMPALAELAARGTHYTNAISPAPWTLPAHGSLFSGLLPHQHGLTGDIAIHEGELRPVTHRISQLAETWLPVLLKRSGYETFAASANPWITPRLGWGAGFDAFVETWRDTRSPRWQLPDSRQRPWLSGVPGPIARTARRMKRALDAARGTRDSGAEQAATSFRAWLRRGHRAPYFAFINLMEAHLPYLPPRPFGPSTTRRIAAASLNATLTNEFVAQHNALRSSLPRGDLEFLRELYTAEIRYLDSRLFEIVAEASESPGETIVLIVGDHGEHLGEHHLLGHQASLSESLLHVPLVLYEPGGGIPAGQFDSEVSTASVPGTLLRLAGVSSELGSLQDPIVWPIVSWYESAYVEAAGVRRLIDGPMSGDSTARRILTQRLWAARIRQLKLVVGSDGTRRLFDLGADPGEESDLASVRPDLMALFDGVEVPFYPRDVGGSTMVHDVSDKQLTEIEEHLSALGYL